MTLVRKNGAKMEIDTFLGKEQTHTLHLTRLESANLFQIMKKKFILVFKNYFNTSYIFILNNGKLS